MIFSDLKKSVKNFVETHTFRQVFYVILLLSYNNYQRKKENKSRVYENLPGLSSELFNTRLFFCFCFFYYSNFIK